MKEKIINIAIIYISKFLTSGDYDDALLSLLADEVIEYIQNDIKAPVPDGLLMTAGKMVAGRYLNWVLSTTADPTKLGLSIEPSVSSITEGDTSVSFSSGDNSNNLASFKAFCDEMANPPKTLFSRYRRLVWH